MIKNLIKKLKNKCKKTKTTQGVIFFGKENNIWFSDDEIKQHTLTFGTTGKGKTSFKSPEEIERIKQEKIKEKIQSKLEGF